MASRKSRRWLVDKALAKLPPATGYGSNVLTRSVEVEANGVHYVVTFKAERETGIDGRVSTVWSVDSIEPEWPSR